MGMAEMIMWTEVAVVAVMVSAVADDLKVEMKWKCR
jgi:hypothetical protein